MDDRSFAGVNEQARWQRLKALFAEGLEQPAGGRAAWLERQEPDLRVELGRLLARQRNPAGLLGADAMALLGNLLPREESTVDAALGSSIGPYRLTRLLGEGGMGRVYLAERVDGQFRHDVALKLIRSEFASAELQQRFLRERDTLARLSHPNIAQLHDGGVSGTGLPYFTLEFIDGEPITRWCDERRLDVRARLRLMLKVCDAVQHAHRNLIVHRDLKPSNILVTAGAEPKLLDFGIAKPLTQQPGDAELTRSSTRPMTPEYAAPEQVLGDPVTTATDVYALGVLLYLLLCGRLPYRLAAQGQTGWTRAILDEAPESLDHAVSRTLPSRSVQSAPGDPRRPDDALDAETIAAARSTTAAALKRRLRGDLDRIVQRALAKRPDARYATVSSMQDDLRAYLDGRALSGGTRTYRLRKFVRRHWLPLAAAAALLVVLVAGAIVVAMEARKVEREARTTAAVKDFLFGLFAAVDPQEAKGREITARDLLERGKQNIDQHPPSDPVVKAELQAVLGRIDSRLGLYAEAGELQRQAIETFGSTGSNALQQAEAELDRAVTLNETHDPKGVSDLLDVAARHLAALPDAPASDRTRLLMEQAQLAIDKRQAEDATRYADAALALARNARVEDDLLAWVLMIAGNAEWMRHAIGPAEAHYREALALDLRTQGSEGPRVASLHANLALVLSARFHYAAALAEAEQALAIEARVFGKDHAHTLSLVANIGLYRFHLGLYRQARETLEDVAARQRRQLGEESPALAGTLINLGLVLAEIPDLAAAEQALTQAVRTFEAKYGRDYRGVRVALSDLAYVHMLQGKLDLAEREFAEVDERNRKDKIDDDASLYYWSAETARLRGDLPTALRRDQSALAAAQKDGESSRFTALAHHYLGLALRDSGDRSGAERELRAALASFGGYIADADHPLAATTRLALGQLLVAAPGSRDEGLRLIAEAVAIRDKFLGSDDQRTRDARGVLTSVTARR